MIKKIYLDVHGVRSRTERLAWKRLNLCKLIMTMDEAKQDFFIRIMERMAQGETLLEAWKADERRTAL